MESITMVKYRAEQIDQILALLTSVTTDSKAYECSLPMMSVVLNINQSLLENAIVFDEPFKNTRNKETADDKENDEVILDAGGANV